MPKPFRKSLLLGLTLLLAACAGAGGRDPVHEHLADRAVLPGFTGIRFWGDVLPEHIDADATLRAAYRAADSHGAVSGVRRLDFLAVSGGGEDGAYGAGVLNGWHARGTRPQFEIVTGVSTGAPIGALAFLGPSRDAQLRSAYTEVATDRIMRKRSVLAVLFGANSLADDRPLAQLIAQTVDERMLDEIASEHRRGRRFFVGTTNLDAQRPVIWDMGAIAASAHPERLHLFRSVLLASASIPGIFPPVRIKVVVDGHLHDELHVDGGVTENAFIFPALFMEASSRLGRHVPRSLYIINNGRLAPDWQETPNAFLPIVTRSITTLAKSHSLKDLFRLYVLAKAHGVEYRLTAIPEEFRAVSRSAFDRDYMNRLYRLGHQIGSGDGAWQSEPPSLGLRSAAR